MTTEEFIRTKNALILRVTGHVLVPENQIVDTQKIKLNTECFRSTPNLNASICPYCSEYIEFSAGACRRCPMAKAGNKCSNKGSTWKQANVAWRLLATKENHEELLELVNQYNKDIK